jgi:hypothetical protein
VKKGVVVVVVIVVVAGGGEPAVAIIDLCSEYSINSFHITHEMFNLRAGVSSQD